MSRNNVDGSTVHVESTKNWSVSFWPEDEHQLAEFDCSDVYGECTDAGGEHEEEQFGRYACPICESGTCEMSAYRQWPGRWRSQCGSRGDVYDFVSATDSCDLSRARSRIYELAEIPEVPMRELPLSPPMRLDEVRHLTDEEDLGVDPILNLLRELQGRDELAYKALWGASVSIIDHRFFNASANGMTIEVDFGASRVSGRLAGMIGQCLPGDPLHDAAAELLEVGGIVRVNAGPDFASCSTDFVTPSNEYAALFAQLTPELAGVRAKARSESDKSPAVFGFDLDHVAVIEPALVSPILGVGDMGLCVGLAGCGKTTQAADIVLAAICPEREGLALGGLLRVDPDQLNGRKIAIIDAEGDRDRWASLLRRKAIAEGLSPAPIEDRVVYIRAEDLGFEDSESWEVNAQRLADLLADHDVGFYVGDTQGKIFSPTNINGVEWIQRAVAPFRMACRKLGITGMMYGHTARPAGNNSGGPKGAFGTSFQDTQCDTLIACTRAEAGGKPGILLELRKSRRAPWIQQGAKAALQFTPAYSYQMAGKAAQGWPHEPPSSSSLGAPSTRQRVLEAVVKANGEKVITRQIVDLLGDVGDRAVRGHLKNLEAEGVVVRVGRGSATSWITPHMN